MQYVNVGCFIRGERPKSKKALREALRNEPHTVRFDQTSMFGDGNDIWGDSVPVGVILSVVLPDPYRDRKAYASVVRQADGKAHVT